MWELINTGISLWADSDEQKRQLQLLNLEGEAVKSQKKTNATLWLTLIIAAITVVLIFGIWYMLKNSK